MLHELWHGKPCNPTEFGGLVGLTLSAVLQVTVWVEHVWSLSGPPIGRGDSLSCLGCHFVTVSHHDTDGCSLDACMHVLPAYKP